MFGADCDHVGDIYECPQGTYAIGRRAPLQNNSQKHKQQIKDICNTNNKLFMILYNCKRYDVLYAVSYIQDFCLGVGGGAPSVLCHTHFLEPTLL